MLVPNTTKEAETTKFEFPDEDEEEKEYNVETE
jgi:hypothetical protein